jgi:hypothetical protein
MRYSTFALAPLMLAALFITPSALKAQPKPGDIYRDYELDKIRVDKQNCPPEKVLYPDCGSLNMRVGDSDPAKRTTPNHSITMHDLQGAQRAEITIGYAKIHGGHLEFQLNSSGTWTPVPQPSFYKYLHMTEVTVPIELNQIFAGSDSIRFRVNDPNEYWPQVILHHFFLRVYFDGSKAHPHATIATPGASTTIGVSPRFSIQTATPEKIAKVDYIGHYYDYNWEGDGQYTRWHYTWLYNARIINHVGRSTLAPDFGTTWNNLWLPDQSAPMQFCARIQGVDGIVYMTEAIGGVSLQRSYSIEMCEPQNLPKGYNTRAASEASRQNTFEVKKPLGLDHADSARVYMTSWGPTHFDTALSEKLSINTVVVDTISNADSLTNKPVHAPVWWSPDYHKVNYDILLDFSVPATNALKPGSNSLAFSRGDEHGLEIEYPGPAVLIRYNYTTAIGSSLKQYKPLGLLRNLQESQLFTIDGRHIALPLTPQLLSGASRQLPAGIYLLRQPDGVALRIRIAAQ